jgi:hypothetical protein
MLKPCTHPKQQGPIKQRVRNPRWELNDISPSWSNNALFNKETSSESNNIFENLIAD